MPPDHLDQKCKVVLVDCTHRRPVGLLAPVSGIEVGEPGLLLNIATPQQFGGCQQLAALVILGTPVQLALSTQPERRDSGPDLVSQLGLIDVRAPAARVLASGAGRDVSEVRAELRAHTQGLNALRETQLEQGRAIAELRQDMGELRQDVGGLRQEMRGGFATMATGMAQITALLTGISGPESDSN